MPLFVLTCLDHPGVLERRMATRGAHLAYLGDQGDAVKLGGPLLDRDSQPNGSMLIIEVADMTEAEAFAAKDPYRKANIFERVDIRPFRLVLGELG